MFKKGQISFGLVLAVVLILFILLGNQVVQINLISFSINSNDKIGDPVYRQSRAKQFDLWFHSYSKGEYEIGLYDCNKQPILQYQNIGSSDDLVIPDEKVPKNCIFFVLYKNGVKLDEKQILVRN